MLRFLQTKHSIYFFLHCLLCKTSSYIELLVIKIVPLVTEQSYQEVCWVSHPLCSSFFSAGNKCCPPGFKITYCVRTRHWCPLLVPVPWRSAERTLHQISCYRGWSLTSCQCSEDHCGWSTLTVSLTRQKVVQWKLQLTPWSYWSLFPGNMTKLLKSLRYKRSATCGSMKWFSFALCFWACSQFPEKISASRQVWSCLKIKLFINFLLSFALIVKHRKEKSVNNEQVEMSSFSLSLWWNF